MKHLKIISNDITIYWDNLESCMDCPCYAPSQEDMFWGICNLSEHYTDNKKLFLECPLEDVKE